MLRKINTDRMHALLANHDIASRCRARAATHLERAIAAVDSLPSTSARTTLIELAQELGDRHY